MPKRTKPEPKPLPHADSPSVVADSAETAAVCKVDGNKVVTGKPCPVCGTVAK